MKPRTKKTAVVAVGILTMAGLSLSQFVPAWADRTMMTKALIEPELELALSDHFKTRFFNLIEATDEQQAKLSGLITRQLDDARPMRSQIREKVMDLSDLIADENATDDDITKKVEEIRAIRDQIQEKRLNTVLKARALLTKDQKQIVAQRIKGILTGNPKLGR